MGRRSRQLSALLVIFCLLLVACAGDDGDDAGPQPTTTAPSTTRSPEEADEQALRRLAQDWYETYTRTFETQGESGVADRFLVDPYLAQFQAQLEDLRESGNETIRSDQSRQVIEEVVVEGDGARVVECVVNANVLVGPGGEVINDEVISRRLETQAVRMESGWRFSERSVLDEFDGDVECAG